MIFDRYIRMPTPDPNDAVAFRDLNGAEQRIGCNSYFGEPNELDKKYMALKPGQRVRFPRPAGAEKIPVRSRLLKMNNSLWPRGRKPPLFTEGVYFYQKLFFNDFSTCQISFL